MTNLLFKYLIILINLPIIVVYSIIFTSLVFLYINNAKAASSNQGVDYFNSSLNSNSFGSSKDPINFRADNIEFNGKLGLIIATGNVVITQGNQTIKADKAYIQKDKNYILAKGNVYLKSEDGKETFGDQIEIKNSLNDAIIDNIKILFSDNSLVAAQSIVKDGHTSTICNAGYTSCPFSKFFAPLWSINAKKITYNEKTRVIHLYNGWLQIKNVPLFWFPYISYADSKVKRQFGLLNPNAGNHSVLGYYYSQPFFVPFGDHSDLYLKLTYFQKKVPFINKKSNSTSNTAPLFQGDYYSYIKNGEVNLSGSFTPNDNKDWAFFGYFQQDLNNTFRLTANFKDATSRNFLTLYKISNYSSAESFLWQDLTLEGFLSNQDYLQIKLEGTKNANPSITRFTNPYILPQLTYSHFGNTTNYGKVDFNLQYANFLTNDLSPNDNKQPKDLAEFDFNKLAMVLKHNVSRATSVGVFSLDSNLQNVNYYKLYLNNNAAIPNERNLFDSYLGGSVAATAQYPIVSNFGSYNSIINPIAQLSYSSLFYNKKHSLAYLDPSTLDINVLNLFENNKYNGFDSFEAGKRFNYGVQWDLINREGLNGQMLIGQSINLNNSEKSNYLIYLGLQPFPYLKVSYTASINNKLSKFEQNNLNVFLGNNLFGSYLSYRALSNLDSTIYNISSLEEVQPGIYVQLTPGLKLTSTATFNLKSSYITDIKSLKRLQGFDASLIWQNSCFSFALKVTRSFYGDINIKPSNAYQFAIIFKNLGGSNLTTDDNSYLNPFQRQK